MDLHWGWLMELKDLNTKQVNNAEKIFLAALPFGAEAVTAALMAAAAESSYLVYANNGESRRPEVWAAYGNRANFQKFIRKSIEFPHDAEAGEKWTTADSLGLFQQRPMYNYGTIAELMDPAESTRIFIRGSKGGKTKYFLQSPPDLSLPARVQWTQGSEFPTGENYAPMIQVVAQLVAKFRITTPPPTPPTPSPNGDLLEDIMAERKVFIAFNAHGSQWILNVLAGTRRRVTDTQAKDQYFNYLRSHGLADAIVDESDPRNFTDQDGVYDSTTEIQ
jgi:hypothetical protein